MKMNQHLMHLYKFPKELVKPRDQFLKDWQKKRHISNARKRELRCAINQFYLFLTEKQVTYLNKVTQALIIQFQYRLYTEFYSTWMVYRKIKDLNLYFDYLHYKGITYTNPFLNIKLVDPPDSGVDKITRYYNFNELITLWTNHLKKQGLNYLSITPKLKSLSIFINFLKENRIKTIYKVKEQTLDEFQKYLYTYQYEPGIAYQPFTQINRLRHVCQFLLFLWRRKLIRTNPSETVNLRKLLRELNSKYWPQITGKKTSPVAGIITPWDELLDKFIDYQLSRGGSPMSTKNYIIAVKLFYKYYLERNKTDLIKITKRDLIDYQSWLYHIKNTNNTKYSPSSLFNHATNLRSFFKFLVKYDYLVCDPSSSIDLPKKEDGIPHNCMAEREVTKLLNQPDTNTPVGIRDKAIMEILYSTGLRINELINLKTKDIDFATGLIRVDTPKGGKSYQRVIPIGRLACFWTEKYIKEVRSSLNGEKDKDTLFLSLNGNPVQARGINDNIKRYLFKLGIRKRITAHSFRVSCATHMLQHDADIRYVQEQLGHKSIRSTQRYTRLVPKNLKQIHTKCHPREKIMETIN